MTAMAVRVLLGALAVLLVVLAWAGVAGALAARDLERARALTASSEDGVDVDSLALAEELARHAQGLLRQPGPVLSQGIPVLGRTVQAARTVAESGVATISSARSAAKVLEERPLVRDGGLDLDTVNELNQVLDAAALAMGPPLQRLAEVDPELLPGPVARGVREAQAELLGADTTAARGAALTSALPGLLGADRPRTVLVVLQNNAELRATGGLISTFAVGTADRGRLVLGPLRDVVEVADPPSAAQRVPSSAEFAQQYGPFLADTTLWKNANMSPDGPSSNAVLAAVASRSLERDVDVVLALDVRAMAEIAAALGSVELADGTTLSADELAEELYVTSYEGLEFSGQERRRELRAAADVALKRVLAGEAPAAVLARRLSEAVAGRHLTLWSADSQEQAALVTAGAAGAVDSQDVDLSMITAHNLGGPGHLQGGGPGEGNKLDYYVRRQVDVQAVVGSDGMVDVTQRLELENTAPEGLGPYVAGFTVPGRVTELVSMYAGGDADQLRLTRDGSPEDAAVSSEFGATVLRAVVRLDRGQSTVWELRYRIPLEGRSYRLRVVPQPLAEDARLDVAVAAAPGVVLESRQSGRWERGGASLDGALDEVRDVHVRVALPQDGLADRLREFWTSPAGS